MATHKIVAQDTKPAKATPPAKPAAKPKNTKGKKRRNPIKAFIGYFAGAWYELKEVRWPNRSASWSLTLAVIVFVVIFTLIISGLDALYKYLFQLVLK